MTWVEKGLLTSHSLHLWESGAAQLMHKAYLT